MLKTLKSRVLDRMEILNINQKRSKYEITFLIGGREIIEDLPKTCAPGCQNYIVDQSILNAMCKSEIHNRNFQAAKAWLDKISEMAHAE